MSIPSRHQFRVLWVEDSADDVFLFSHHLTKEGIQVDHKRVETPDEFERELYSNEWDAVLSDYHMPGLGPMDALELLKKSGKDLPFVVLSGVLEVENAVELMKSGVHDFVSKNNPARLGSVIQREVREAEMRSDRLRAFAQLEINNQKLDETLKRLREAQQEGVKQERLRLMGEISLGISHEFNNALMKMMGLHARISSDLGNDVKLDDHRETIDLLGTSINEASGVAKRLSNFYSDNFTGEVESIKLSELVMSIVDSVGRYWTDRCESRSVKVETSFLDDAARIKGNKKDLWDAITNILHNAADAMVDGGVLGIVVSEAKGRVSIEISDTGCGMDATQMKRCMEPFYSTKGEFGTGLGMCLTENIVQRYEGSIYFASEVGKGTVVTLSFPKSQQMGKEVLDGRGEDLSAKRGSLSILIAEDEPVVAMIIEEYLQLAGHNVEATSSGGDAVKAFDRGGFDLVITDMSMPGLSGDEVARHVKNKSPNTPVFLMTGHGELMISRGQVPEGVDQVIPKPIDRKSLYQAIDDGLAR